MLVTEENRMKSFSFGDLLGISEAISLAFFKTYYDESFGHPSLNPRLFFVGGCTLSAAGWNSLKEPWNDALKEFSVSIYRASDCNTSRGQYTGWDGIKKDRFRQRLIRVVDESWRNTDICPVIQYCGLNMIDFNLIAEQYPHAILSPYEFCVWILVAGSRSAIANIRGDNSLGIFFEDGQDVRPHIRKKLQQQQKSESRIVDISFVSKEDHLPLQVADMIAFEAFKSHTEGMRKTFENLLAISQHAGFFYSESQMRDFFRNNF